MEPQRFPSRIGRRSAGLLRRVFGVRAETAWTAIEGGRVVARFGRMSAETPLSNVVSWRAEGPWRWITAIGVRGSIRHGDLTFGGTHRGGIRLNFREPVRVGPLRIPALYVTPEDIDGLAAALTAAGIPGEDARGPGAR